MAEASTSLNALFPHQNAGPKDYGNAKAYAEEVRNWMIASQSWMMHQQMAAMQAAMAFMQVQHGVTHPPSQHGAIVFRRLFTADAPQTTITQQYVIPSFMRRVVAELLDFSILFIWKMIVVYFLIEVELMQVSRSPILCALFRDLDQYDKILSNDVDVQTFIDLTQGLFHMEIVSGLFESIPA